MRDWSVSNVATLFLGTLLGLFVAFAPQSSWAIDRYIDPTGSDGTGGCVGPGTNDCSVQGSPCLTIGQGIACSISGDTIRLAAGDYDEDTNADASLEIDGATLASLTIIGAGESTTTISPDTVATRVFNIINGPTVTMSDLTITGGSCPTGGTDHGAGIRMDSAGTLTLTDVTIDSNVCFQNSFSDGGGMWLEDITFTGTNVTITNNDAAPGLANQGTGGGVYLNVQQGLATFTCTNCNINNNSAGQAGGGIFSLNGNITLTGGTLNSNEADDGGGLRSIGSSGTVAFNSMSCNNNTAGAAGNSSGRGGCFYNDGQQVTIDQSELRDNSAVDLTGGSFSNGGAGYNLSVCSTGTITITNSVVDGNSANEGGGFFNFGGSCS